MKSTESVVQECIHVNMEMTVSSEMHICCYVAAAKANVSQSLHVCVAAIRASQRVVRSRYSLHAHSDDVTKSASGSSFSYVV